jgi:hypothetical protein
MDGKPTPVVLDYASSQPAPRRYSRAGGYLNAAAMLVLFIDIVRPHLSSPPRSLFSVFFHEYFIWLGCALSVASVILTLRRRERQWGALIWRLLILACIPFVMISGL